MFQGIPESRRYSILAAALILAFFLQTLFASLQKSPTFDEPVHISAALSFAEKQNFRPDPQHPPLIRELSGISLLAAGIRLPDSRASRIMLNGSSEKGMEWAAGNATGISVIARNGPAKALFWARLPIVLLATLLAFLIYAWGRRMLGEAAALGALFLYALDPTVIAHSGLITTDAGVATLTLLFFFVLWFYLGHPTRLSLVLCGLALGAALSAKFSAVFFLPVAAILILAGSKRIVPFLTMCAIAAAVILAVYLSPTGLANYIHGILRVNADHDPNYQVAMAGMQHHNFLTYFAVAYLIKEPLVTIALVAFGSFALIRSRTVPLLDKLFLFLPPAALFLAVTLFADNLGIRYILPALPFAYPIGGYALARVRRPAIAAALCLWLISTAIGIYPDHLSYFNEAACILQDPSKIGFDGGTRCGPWWLDDSNVDWGQGLQQLQVWLAHHPQSANIRLAWFGTFPPQSYGIHFDEITDNELIAPMPARYIVSGHIIAQHINTWLGTTKPTAVVGHSLYVFDIVP